MWYNYTITPTETRGGQVTISGSVTFTTGLQLDLSVDFDIEGVASVGVSVPLQFEVSTSQSFSDAFYFSVHNTDTGDHYFRAYIQGGSNTETGVIIHLWQLG
jgi:hypothetical protein